MDPKLVFAKTSIGDEAVRQSTRVVQRNLRMVLVQVDGNLSVEDLSAKIGDARLVEKALRDLEEGGFIAPIMTVPSGRFSEPLLEEEAAPVVSQFSTFGPRSMPAPISAVPYSAASNFSSFGGSVAPAALSRAPTAPAVSRQPEAVEGREVVPRKRLRISLRSLLSVGVAALLAFVLIVLFYPYQGLRPGIEAAAGRLLQAPVRVGEVSVGLWPRPALLLTDIRIGEGSDARIGQARLSSPLSLLGNAPHVISLIELSNVVMPADRLLALPGLGVVPGGAGVGFLVRRVSIEKMSVQAGALTLDDLSGKLSFREDGNLDKAQFEAAGRTLRIEATASPQGLLLAIEGLGWQTGGGKLVFDALQAKGLLQKGKLLVRDIDTTMLGGVLKGNWLLDWNAGLVMAGEASLQRLDCRKVAQVFAPSLNLEGELSGSLRLRSGGRDRESLASSIEATLDADVTRGLLHGVDLGEVARRGPGSTVHGGATKFDHLRASLTINPRQVSGRDILMSAGMVTANGQFVAGREKPVDANLLVTMQTSVSMVRTPVKVSGELPNLDALSVR
jgi:hypothetical protein